MKQVLNLLFTNKKLNFHLTLKYESIYYLKVHYEILFHDYKLLFLIIHGKMARIFHIFRKYFAKLENMKIICSEH